MKRRVLLVDGMALLFRGYYATAYRGNFMKTDSGIPTNGVYQFLRYFLNAIETFKPSHVLCLWDMGKETFRTEIYDQYKKNRSEPPQELIPQFDLVKEVVTAFEVPNIGVENYEADDCIGTLACELAPENEVIIQTGDYDLLQLVQPEVQVALMKKGIGNYNLFNEGNFYEKRGLYPQQMVDFKALTGDTADNYPGVKGIGEKTALKLLQNYRDITEILASLENLPNGVKNRIHSNIEMLHISQSLAKINCDVPVNYNLSDALWSLDKEKVQERINRLGVKITLN